MKPHAVFRLVTKHALNALGYRDLALADLTPPIVVIGPDDFALENAYRVALQVAAEADTLAHASRMFDRGFSTVQEFVDFLKQFSDAEQLVSGLSDQSRLLFNSQWSGPLVEQIGRYAKEEVESKIQLPEGGVTDIILL
jgi:hypothetical protein